MPTITDALAAIGDLSTSFAPASPAALSDDELLVGQRAIAEVRRRLDSLAAAVAGEIAHRSRRELGREGLAQSRGQRTPEGLISLLTGSSARDARTFVKAAELLPVETTRAASVADAPAPAAWSAVLGRAVATATISVAAADVIRIRLAAVDRPDLSPAVRERVLEALAVAAEKLVAEAQATTIEQLAARAARARDDIDAAGVAAREEALREARYLRVTRQLDGTARIQGVLDPESAAIVIPILDAATSPRRGGPRFVDPDAAARADDLVRDERATEQLALDTFVDLLQAGARVDPGRLLGDRTPAVRILVTKADLDTPADTDGHRPGAAYFEDQTDAVSIATAERYICSSGAVPILFDGDGRVLNLGREQRLFSQKQRLALAARDGGCRMCDRPPSWCEAHHIDHWDEHHGRTDIDDGVLLCRFCHLTVHNRGWRIRRRGTDYLLEHPDEHGTLRHTPLPTRSPALQRLLTTA